MIEIWKDINGYNGIYKVSNLGRVKSLANKYNRKEIILKGFLRSGYVSVNLYKDRVVKNAFVHQLVAESFIDKNYKNKGLVCDHINNNRLDNHLSNLQIITIRENSSKNTRNSNNKTSKYPGVHYNKLAKKYRADIVINKRKVYLGYFDNEYNAHLAYQKKLSEIKNLQQ